jgi:hypothetical protein
MSRRIRHERRWHAIGIPRRTLQRWAAKYPEFRDAIKLAKAAADDRVERSLYERACGYHYEAVKIFPPRDGGQPVIVPYMEHVPADTRACETWLYSRRPERWRNRAHHEMSGLGGGPIETKGGTK